MIASHDLDAVTVNPRGLMMSEPSFWKNKKVLITGHTGFKGSWLCKTLEKDGARITGYALPQAKGPSLFDICEPDVDSVFADIRDFERLSEAFKKSGPDVVFHMAAQPLVMDSYKNPHLTYDTNVMGTVNMLECVRNSDTVRSVINVTTDKVYLNRERREGYTEDEALDGYDPYSNSKSCSEIITSGYRNSFLGKKGVAVSTVRSGNVIGGGDFTKNRLLPDCALTAFMNKGHKPRVRDEAPFNGR